MKHSSQFSMRMWGSGASRDARVRAGAWLQLKQLLRPQGVSKSEMALRMRTSRSQLDRILGDHDGGMTLETLSRALDALGLGVRLEIRDTTVAKQIVRKSAAKKSRRMVSVPPRKANAAKTPVRKRA